MKTRIINKDAVQFMSDDIENMPGYLNAKIGTSGTEVFALLKDMRDTGTINTKKTFQLINNESTLTKLKVYENDRFDYVFVFDGYSSEKEEHHYFLRIFEYYEDAITLFNFFIAFFEDKSNYWKEIK